MNFRLPLYTSSSAGCIGTGRIEDSGINFVCGIVLDVSTGLIFTLEGKISINYWK